MAPPSPSAVLRALAPVGALLALGLPTDLLASPTQQPGPAATPLSAQIWNDCAPWDGAAFTVTMPWPARPSRPAAILSIAIWKAPTLSHPTQFSFPADDRIGSITLQPRPGLDGLLKGRVSFRSVVPGQPVLGSFDLVSPRGERVHGSFRASWVRRQALCG
ncbi:hypothetical protein [Cyanobium sp. Morenito 9A2]|uniref:hypothetical protein n=1 Tax=Cyanobium sp. Morenito 9A2 TaxID=2823718 RepID=UPI0020CD132B|nr:hypothetical protein [Cyanobium sp. Morenito 9A2]MCP9849539.1 hypothetical protein [Cyanobium sp. Morenito 9A2]